MIKTVFAVALMAVPFTHAAAAPAPTPFSFSAEGNKYRYTIATDGDARIIKGTELNSGKRFSLRYAANGHVSGTYNGSFMSFDAAKPKAAAEIASR